MLVGTQSRRVAIVGGARILFVRAMGACAECSNLDMLSAALQGVVEKFGLAGRALGDVGAGAVRKHPRDFNLAREAVLGTSLAPLGAIDRSKLNVNGGSLAVGHPFAATGARILAGMAKAIDQRGSGRGLISICTAGGTGVTAIVEK